MTPDHVRHTRRPDDGGIERGKGLAGKKFQSNAFKAGDVTATMRVIDEDSSALQNLGIANRHGHDEAFAPRDREMTVPANLSSGTSSS